MRRGALTHALGQGTNVPGASGPGHRRGGELTQRARGHQASTWTRRSAGVPAALSPLLSHKLLCAHVHTYISLFDYVLNPIWVVFTYGL